MKRTGKTALLFVLFILLGLNAGYSQVGINTDDPDPSSSLEIDGGKGGLLIPRMSTAEREDYGDNGGIGGEATTGNLVLDTTLNKFFMYNSNDPDIQNDGEWIMVNPWHKPWKQMTDEPATADTLVLQKEVSAVVKIEGKLEVNDTLTAKTFVGYGVTPIGGIIMWSGNPLSLPDGWTLCDNPLGSKKYIDYAGVQQNIPDLSGRFIVGYDKNDTEYNIVGETGPYYIDGNGTSTGSNTTDAKRIKLTPRQSGVADHTHYIDGETNTDGLHSHTGRGTIMVDEKDGGPRCSRNHWSPVSGDLGGGTGDVTLTDGAHKHIIKFESKPNITTIAQDFHENRPPFFVLAFIIRVK